MASVVFFMDIEEGHILPSLALAHALRERGHQVTYIGIPDGEALVKNEGIPYQTVFQHLYPVGFREQYKHWKRRGARELLNGSEHLGEILKGAADEMVRHLRPDLLIVSTFLSLEALLLYYRLKIQTAIFTPFLRFPGSDLVQDCKQKIMSLPGALLDDLIVAVKEGGWNCRSLAELVAPLVSFPELVPCHRELLSGFHMPGPRCRYLGHSVRLREEKEGNPEEWTTSGKNILYASLGSQTISYHEKAHLFFDRMIDMMGQEVMREYQLVMSVGLGFDPRRWANLPDNVLIKQWVPQLTILQKASLAIVHGGFGTIRECIYFGVPMLVFPVAHDQHYNASLVSQKRLGRQLDVIGISAGQLAHTVQQIIDDPEMAKNIRHLKRLFQEEPPNEPGTEIVEEFLRRHIT